MTRFTVASALVLPDRANIRDVSRQDILDSDLAGVPSLLVPHPKAKLEAIITGYVVIGTLES